jgi:RNA-directed DNA polymerase
METRCEAEQLAKANDGALGLDGETFAASEASGGEAFLQQSRDARVPCPSRPRRNRRQAIPTDGGQKGRVRSIQAMRDRVVQGARKRSLEPIYAAAGQPGSFGDRAQRRVHEAVHRVAEAIARH